MVIKFFYTLVVIFGVAMVLVVAQDPYLEDGIVSDFNISNIQLTNVDTYEISELGVVGIYSADRIDRFKDHDEFFGFKAKSLLNGKLHNLSSKTAIKNGNEIKFIGDVVYENSDSVRLISQLAFYNIDKKEGFVPDEFVMWRGSDVKIKGTNLSYSANSDIRAVGVKAWLER